MLNIAHARRVRNCAARGAEGGGEAAVKLFSGDATGSERNASGRSSRGCDSDGSTWFCLVVATLDPLHTPSRPPLDPGKEGVVKSVLNLVTPPQFQHVESPRM